MKHMLRKATAAALILTQTVVPTLADSFLYRHVTSGETIVVQSSDEITVPGKVVELEPLEPIDANGEPFVQLPNSVDALTAGLRFDADFDLSNANGLAIYGSIPPGLYVDAISKTISGVPTRGGSYTFNLRAFLTVPGQDLKTYDSNSLTIDVLPVLSVANTGVIEGFVGTSVSGGVTTDGTSGTVTFEFETAEENRPSWLALDQSGNLTGIALDPGSWSIAIRATDEEGRTGVTSIPVNAIDDAIITVEDAYGATIGQNSGFSPELSTGSWEGFIINEGTLPPGMEINSETGRISGIPTQLGSYSFKIVADLLGRTVSSETTTINVRSAVAASVSPMPSGYQNDEYNTDDAAYAGASGGYPPYSYSLSGGVTGISINSATGIFEGTPTGYTTKPATAYVTVTDSEGRTDTAQTSVSVTREIAMTRVPTLDQRPMVGRSLITDQIGQAQYGNGGYSWSVDNGPAWLSMSGSSFSGTPTETGTFNYDVVVTDNTGHSKISSQSFTVDEELTVSEPAFGQTQINEVLNVLTQPIISGGVAPYAVSLSGAPEWMTVNSSGELGGTATTSGNLSFNLVVEDAHERITRLPIAFNLASGLYIKEPIFSNTMTGEAFAFERQIEGSGGFEPYSWEIGNFGSSGNPGLSIDETTGELSGTAEAPGFYSFDVTMTDARGSVAERTVEVAVADNIAITAPEFALSMVGDEVNVISNPVRTGGTAPFNWELTSAPAWLSINNATGVLSGVPTSNGDFNVTILATDSQGHSESTNASLEVSPEIILTAPSVAETKTGELLIVNAQASATGGNGDFTWTMSGAPSWMSLNSSTGAIDGIAGTPDITEDIAIKVTDARGLTRNTSFNVTVFDDLTLAAPVFNTAEQGVPLSLSQAKATYGVQPYDWSLHGDIPSWLTFSETNGSLAGIPTYKGTYEMTIEVSDALGDSKSANFTLSVDPVITMTAPVFEPVAPGGKIEMASQPSAEGGYGKKTYSMTDAPNGLRIDSSRGWISGTAPNSGSYNFQIVATDENGDSTSITANLTVAEELVALEPSFGITYIGNPLSVTENLSFVGGYEPVSWSLEQGPEWLQIGGDGVISGTPDASGVSLVEAKVTDWLGSEATVEFYVEALSELSIENPTFDHGFKGGPVPLATQPQAIGGVAPYSWSLLAADETLSVGINSNTGELTIAETTEEGNFPVSVSLADNDNNYVETTFNVPVLPVLSLIAPTVSTSVIDDSIVVAKQVVALGGQAPLEWSISGQPSWIVFDSNNGAISGTATETGTFSFDITAVDVNDISATVEVSVTVTNPVAVSVDDILDAEVGIAIGEYNASTSFGVSPYNWEITSGPTWLSISDNGALSGTPDSNVDGSFSVRATDALGYTASASGSVRATTPLSLEGLVFANRGMLTLPVEVDTQPNATGGDGSYTWSISGAPAGVSIDSATGIVSGTPTETGSFNIIVTVRDGDGREASGGTSLAVDDEILVSFAPTFGAIQTRGDEVSVEGSPAALSTGGFGAKTWSVEFSEGDTHLGNIFSAAGSTSGRSWSNFGTSSFDLVVTDANGRSARHSYSETTVDDALSIAWDYDIDPLRQGDNLIISTAPVAQGGTTPYTWSLADGHQATFVQLTDTHLPNPSLGGVAWNTVATRNLALKVTDADGREISITKPIAVTHRLDISGFEYAPATRSTPFQTTSLPTAVNGTAPFTWSASQLPSGLSIDPNTGQISGSPTTQGTFQTTINATSAEGYTGTEQFEIHIEEILSISAAQSVRSAYEGLPISWSNTNVASGGNGDYTWGLRDSPTGFNIDANTGILTGTGPAAGSHSVNVTLTDSDGRYAERAISVPVSEDLQITSSDLLTLTVGLSTNGSQSPFSVSGGTNANYNEWILLGAPSWLQINSSTGDLSLVTTPDTAGTYSVTARIYDEYVTTARDEVSFDVVVRDRLLVTAAALPPSTDPGTSFSALTEAVATGGSGNYTWYKSGDGGSGLTISSDGIIGGTANSTTGIYSERIIVEDDEGRSAYFDLPFIGIGEEVIFAEDSQTNAHPELNGDGVLYFRSAFESRERIGSTTSYNYFMGTYEYDDVVIADSFQLHGLIYRPERVSSWSDLKVQISEDGATWETVATVRATSYNGSYIHSFNTTVNFGYKEFKYYRLLLPGQMSTHPAILPASPDGHRFYEFRLFNSTY